MTEPRSLAEHLPRPMDDIAERKQWAQIRERRAAKRRKRWALLALGLAATAALLVAIPWHGDDALAAGDVLAATETATTVQLADGTEILMEAATALEAEAAEPTEVRLGLRSGRARFDVAHDPSRAFRVMADNVAVRVVGTRFWVGRDGDAIEVIVERGAVEVRDPEGIRVLHAGDRYRSDEPPEAPEAEAETPETLEPEVEAERSAPRVPAASVLFARAREAHQAGNDQEAAEQYAALLRHHRRDSRAGVAALALGRLRLDLGQPARAIAPLRIAARSGPNRADALARLVEAYDASGRSADCRRAREQYLERYPEGVHRAAVVRRCAP